MSLYLSRSSDGEENFHLSEKAVEEYIIGRKNDWLNGYIGHNPTHAVFMFIPELSTTKE